MSHTKHDQHAADRITPGSAEHEDAIRAEVEAAEHELTLAVVGLPQVPNEYGGDAAIARLRVFFGAGTDEALRPTGLKFLDAVTEGGYFLAPAAWERPDGWPTWLRDFADRITPGRTAATPTGVEVTVESHRVKVVLSVANIKPVTGPDAREVPVAKVALGYVGAVPQLIRFTLEDGTELFVPPADLEQPERLPQPLRQLVDEFRPAACGI